MGIPDQAKEELKGNEWTKPCTGCGREEPEVEFYDYRATGGRKMRRCKDCMRKNTAAICKANRELERAEGVERQIDVLKTVRRNRRHVNIFYMIQEGHIKTPNELRAILENVTIRGVVK